MNLAELQRGFRTWLVEASDDAARELTGDSDPGLFVYQNNYRGQLVACLQSSFPQTRAFMGEEAFLHAAVAHIDARPPYAWTLDAYAAHFGETLRTEFPLNPDVHDLAWIEQSLGTAFVAGDAQPITAADLANVNWDTARLQFTPTLLTTQASTNAADIWWAMQEGTQHPDGEMLPESRGLQVWRRGFTSCLRTLDPLEYDALMHAQSNGSFPSLCEMLITRLGEEQGVAKAGELLADWIGSELVTGVEP
ncbi:putative DNA-binding domain-containing protein [Pseudoduganella sp. UC29_106]|uniref:HvfC/BufC family peptide modification chaperone n=1 Tax=Pseudoduganella sp. UC29_106 TaxID=3374553 RepID=UPI0037574793